MRETPLQHVKHQLEIRHKSLISSLMMAMAGNSGFPLWILVLYRLCNLLAMVPKVPVAALHDREGDNGHPVLQHIAHECEVIYVSCLTYRINLYLLTFTTWIFSSSDISYTFRNKNNLTM